MTESMKFGPEWLRNISNDGMMPASTTTLATTTSATSVGNNKFLKRSFSNKDDRLTDNNHHRINRDDIRDNFNSINHNGDYYVNETNNCVDGNNSSVRNTSGDCYDNNSSDESYDYNSSDYFNDINDASQMLRYQLAEFRYGREEMLSLFDRTIKLPELLPKFKKLFIEKMQTPLALIPNEDEMVSLINFD